MAGYIGSKSSVTLVDGYTEAEADAEFVAITGDTMSGGLTVQGAFTSVGIDDNADAVALTIDSSENVLIGQTTAGSNTVGTSLRSDGRNFYCADGNYSAHFNRKSSDGAIAHFAKDDTIVGTIGVLNSNNVTISGTVADHGGLQFGTHCVIPMEANADSNGTIDLGSADSRFKDAYLSGGVCLGGTGAANKLDDYEEGTWTPTAVFSSSGSPTYSRQTATYTKIGRFVFCDVSIIFQKNTGSGNLSIEGFPFNNTTGEDRGIASFGYFSGINGIPIGLMSSNSAKCVIRTALASVYNDDTNGNALISDGQLDAESNFHFSVVYKTSA